eukprot:Awhi_evm1s9710
MRMVLMDGWNNTDVKSDNWVRKNERENEDGWIWMDGSNNPDYIPLNRRDLPSSFWNPRSSQCQQA